MSLVTMKLIDNSKGGFGADFNRRLQEFDRLAATAALRAAAEAERVSKQRAKAIRPPAPARRGRRLPAGALAYAINWIPTTDHEVELDLKTLNQRVPWWVTQEIGTGKKATIKRGQETGTGNPRGRPTNSSRNQPGSNFVSVKTQIGRRIPNTLGFSTSPTGHYAHPGGRRDQQLFLLKNLKGVPPSGQRGRTDGLFIRHEIKPKHFIREGAREGFRDYRNDLVAAAKATLSKRK